MPLLVGLHGKALVQQWQHTTLVFDTGAAAGVAFVREGVVLHSVQPALQ